MPGLFNYAVWIDQPWILPNNIVGSLNGRPIVGLAGGPYWLYANRGIVVGPMYVYSNMVTTDRPDHYPYSIYAVVDVEAACSLVAGGKPKGGGAK
jgi:hypothetical protein